MHLAAARRPRHVTTAPGWGAAVLLAAGIYNLTWGALVMVSPGLWFSLLGMDLPRYPQIWQTVGMIVGVYGIGYLIAAYAPLRHWPIVLVGLLGKLFGPAGFLVNAWRGELPWQFGLTIITNDVIWWVPFAAILVRAWQSARAGEGDLARRRIVS